MATVNKDFKIKSGLIVEGLQGTINGETILTEVAGDEYILNLIGGETLVKSVSNEFDVSVAGRLSLDRAVVDAYYDAAGEAQDVQDNLDIHTNASSGVHGVTGSVVGTTDAQDLSNKRIIDALQFSDGVTVANEAEIAVEAITHNFNVVAKSGDLVLGSLYDDVVIAPNSSNAYLGTPGATTKIATEGYVDQAESDAITAAASDATTKANTAEQNAKDYADDLINDASNLSTEVWSAYKTSTEIGLAQTAAEGFATQAIANLVDSAPTTLDTLNELAQALQDNPDIISDLQDIAAGKQDTLTAGSNIEITGLNVINVTGLDAADISDFNTAALSATAAAYDIAGAAATAQGNAEDYADGLAVNYDAAGSAATAEQNAKNYADALDTDDVAEGSTNQYFLDSRAKSSAADLLTGANLTNITITGTGAGLTITAENGVADSTTTDLAEGTNKYFTDARARDAVDGTDRSFTSVELNSVAKQVAATLSAPTAGIQVAHAFPKAEYRSAEYLVKVAYGTHTEISKVLLTLDSSDNIAITEYGIVGTNGSASSISAGVSGANVQLQVTTANVNSTVTVVGTLLA